GDSVIEEPAVHWSQCIGDRYGTSFLILSSWIPSSLQRTAVSSVLWDGGRLEGVGSADPAVRPVPVDLLAMTSWSYDPSAAATATIALLLSSSLTFGCVCPALSLTCSLDQNSHDDVIIMSQQLCYVGFTSLHFCQMLTIVSGKFRVRVSSYLPPVSGPLSWAGKREPPPSPACKREANAGQGDSGKSLAEDRGVMLRGGGGAFRLLESWNRNERKVKEKDRGVQTDGGPVVRATLPPRESPDVDTTLAPSLPLSYPLHHAQRGSAASYRLAAVFGSRHFLNPASPHLAPEGGAMGSDSHVELLFSAITNVPTLLTSQLH
ncbi:unnamed protein product, partial [Pleuronectes platessa]